MSDYIAMPDLVPRGIYYIKSRNLISGAWNPATQGFVGIREKFSDRYLFTEYHYDTGSPLGTVRPIEQIGTLTPGIELAERLGDRMNRSLFDALEQYEESLYARQDEEFRLLEVEQKAQEEARWQSGEGWRMTEDRKNWVTIDGRTKTNSQMAEEARARYR